MRAHALDPHTAAMDLRAGCVRYEILVRGQLSETLLGAFPTMHAETQNAVTALTGSLPDQAALYGALAQIEALGLELLALRRLNF
jgi:hypothetical protein